MDYIEAKPCTPPASANGTIDLADPRLGAAIVAVSDQFFAPAERMLSPEPARFYPDRYDDHGKWMDGWESRRRRGMGHDWCIVRLAVPGTLAAVDLDTSFFTGNYPPGAMLEACYVETGDPDTDTEWSRILAPVSLGPDSHHLFDIDSAAVWSHLRLNILPDGGIARLRVFGQVAPAALEAGREINLAALELGARVVAWNDSHYGHPNKILLPTQGVNMGDGWETRRRREPGNDWCIIALATAGEIDRVEVDTAYFKGNFPDRCSLQAAALDATTDEAIITQSMFWDELMPEQKLSADAVHSFSSELKPAGAVTHVRVNVFPDGGISRLRLYGRIKSA